MKRAGQTSPDGAESMLQPPRSAQLPVIRPAWSGKFGVHVASTTRVGGCSRAPYGSFNLGLHVEDDAEHVHANRALLQPALELPGRPLWLRQVHGCEVLSADSSASPDRSGQGGGAVDPSTASVVTADAATTAGSDVIVVLTADCLPVVLADADGARVSVVHAGWRGLAAGVIEAALAHHQQRMPVRAWLGPAIGPAHFEVGEEVRDAFMQHMPATAAAAFVAGKAEGKWFADLYQLARDVLRLAGVDEVSGGNHCTFAEPGHFFSHRRDGPATGRMATLAWLEPR